MRAYRYLHAVYRLYDLLAAVVLIVADFARFAPRIEYGNTWRFIREIGIAANRKIKVLSPEYQASYDTHGLSLDPRMRY